MLWFSLAYAADEVCSSWTASELVTEVDRIPSEESSALALTDDGFLTLDDSDGAAALYAFDIGGNFLKTITVEGATNTDWEDLAVAACSEGECVYIADIGDNDETREQITIWRAPLVDGAAVEAVACPLAYDDGEAHDAEALLVFPDGSVRVVTKSAGTTRVYHSPALTCDGTAQTLAKEAELSLEEPVTGGAVSVDGSLVVLRGATVGWVWRGCTLDWSAAPFDLLFVGEEQGEGVAIDEDGTIFSSSEGTKFELHQLPCASEESLVCEDCGCTASGGWGGAWLGVLVGAVAVAWRRR